MAYATPEDVSSRLGRDLDESEALIVNVRLNDVERLIRSRKPSLDADITSGMLDVEVVKQVEAEAVLRLVRNPEGYRSETDGNYSYQIDASVASGRISILDDEWALLGASRGAFVIRPFIGLSEPLATNNPVWWDWPEGEWSP